MIWVDGWSQGALVKTYRHNFTLHNFILHTLFLFLVTVSTTSWIGCVGAWQMTLARACGDLR